MEEVKLRFDIFGHKWGKDTQIPTRLADYLGRIAKKLAKLFPRFCSWTHIE